MTKKRKKAAASASPLVLDEKIGIQDINGLVDQLTALLKSDAANAINANAVRNIDTAALQVLIAFANGGGDVEWQHEEGTLQEHARLAGVDDLLKLAAASAASDDDGLCPVF